MPDKSKPLYLNLSTLGQFQAPPNPGPGWVGPERPAESWADVRADPLSALFDLGRGAVTGDAPAGMNVQGLGALLAAAMPMAQGAKALRGATKAAKLSELADEATQAGIRAYHGSPHDFDKFSLEKIGTGEGAQAYGHGLYFAENPAVAQEYKKTLAGGIDEWDHDLGYGVREPKTGQIRWFANEKDAKEFAVDRGKMYEVQIHASPDQFLDWDKPLSEQSDHVKAAVDKAAQDLSIQSFAKEYPGEAHPPTGEALYNYARNVRGTVTTAEKLKEAGIPGIRYLDAGSRSAGEGSRNFVIFDDSLVSILKKYGIALPVIEGLRERAKQNGGVISRQDVDGLQ